MVYQELPLNRFTNPFRNEGYLLRLSGGLRNQRGGSIGGILTQKRRRPKRTHRKRNRQLGRGIKELVEEAVDLGMALGRDPSYKRMGAVGVKGHYDRRAAPWEV